MIKNFNTHNSRPPKCFKGARPCVFSRTPFYRTSFAVLAVVPKLQLKHHLNKSPGAWETSRSYVRFFSSQWAPVALEGFFLERLA